MISVRAILPSICGQLPVWVPLARPGKALAKLAPFSEADTIGVVRPIMI